MKKNIGCLQMAEIVWDSEPPTNGSSRLASRIRRKGSSSLIGNMIYWIVIEFIVVFIFRYICLFVFGHDLFDVENNVNRFIYLVIIVASLLWLKGDAEWRAPRSAACRPGNGVNSLAQAPPRGFSAREGPAGAKRRGTSRSSTTATNW